MPERTVLVIDDDPNIRRLLRYCLSDWTVHEAQAGDEGWSRLQDVTPDLLIVDWMMPGLTGPELVQRLRLTPQLRDLPVILLTARDEGGAEAYRHGVDHYVEKPFHPEEVRAIVDRVMERQARLQGFIAPMMEAIGRRLPDRDLPEVGQALKMLGEIQKAMFPRSGRQIGDFDVGADLHASLVTSGDFFDLLPRRDGTWALVVGDVSGKGPAAAFFMVMVRTALRTLAREDHSLLHDVLALNEIMLAETPEDWFVTMVYLVLQPATGSLTYASAGHWPVLIYHPDRPLRRLENTGPALGIFRDFPIEIAHAGLEPGDIAVAYTDGLLDGLGLTDVEQGHQWLVDQLAGLAALPADEIAHAILDQARPSAEEARQDDQTVMVIKRG